MGIALMAGTAGRIESETILNFALHLGAHAEAIFRRE
jgi:hypothetical protein